jgi:type IV fimbrial biogenesis protein FimT
MDHRMTNYLCRIGGRAKPQSGFSMIELMVVLAIAAILLTIGAPSFREMIQNQRMTATVNDFFMAINLTRSEAIQRGSRVDLVPAGDGTDWTKGWVVFIDQNNNHKSDAGDKIIFSHGPVPDGIIIKADFNDSSAQYLAYNGTGRTRINANSQTAQAGHFSFTLDKNVRKIILNFLGRPRVCNPDVDATAC